MDIREQIDDLNCKNVLHGPLRSFSIARCKQFADTMEKLLAVYEAAEKIPRVESLRKGGHQFPELERALALVQTRQVLSAPVEADNFTREEVKAAVRVVKKP